MRVLFVHSGNSERYPVSPFVLAQAGSLRAEGVDVGFFAVKGRGLGYLRNVGPLRARIRAERPDVVHAHYALCGWVAVLARDGRPIAVSFMGDDAQGTFNANGGRTLGGRVLVLLARLLQPFVQAVIVKSEAMARVVWRRRILHVVPNGVDLDVFRPGAVTEPPHGIDPAKKHVLFLGDPADPNKNVRLVRDAMPLLDRADVALAAPHGIAHAGVVRWMNAANALALCSFAEGSPNVIKEAMAMGLPIVTVRAGDAAWVVGDTPGCFVAGYTAADFADKLERALVFEGRTNGRARIIGLGLDAPSVARKLKAIYAALVRP